MTITNDKLEKISKAQQLKISKISNLTIEKHTNTLTLLHLLEERHSLVLRCKEKSA